MSNNNLLIDQEIDIMEMDRRRKLAYILRKKEQELVKEQNYAKRNICPHCHMVLCKNGNCPRCSYKKPKN